MIKIVILFVLCLSFLGYTVLVYTQGTENDISLSPEEQKQASLGKIIYQENNCMSCHQIYGLGGYLGPDLTKAFSDKRRGEAYMRALLQSGGTRMPNFNFKKEQIDALIAYLKYVDKTAANIKY